MTAATVERAIRDYPDVYARVRAVCTYGAINLDLHAARIVLEIAALKKQKQGQSPQPVLVAATGPNRKEG